MIFPIGDDNSDRATAPVVNYALIAINILVFVFLQGLGSNDRFTYAFSTVPAEIATGRDVDRPVVIQGSGGADIGRIDLQPTPGSVYLTLITSMFMHGGYILLFPRNQVRVIMLRVLTTVPAYVAIGLWFVLQLIESFGALGAGPEAGGGVAYAAHIGGFIAGLALIKIFAIGRGPTANQYGY